MSSRSCSCVVSSLLAITGSAFAGIDAQATAFGDLSLWQADGTDLFLAGAPEGWVTEGFVEDLAALAPGEFASVTGGSGWNSWTMAVSGPGGDLSVADGQVRATTVGSGFMIGIVNPGAPDGSGVHGIGGDFGFRSASGESQAGEIELELSTGDSLVREISAGSPFAGFWTLNPEVTITGITLRPLGTASGAFFATVDNLYMAYGGLPVPAPGAMALLFAAGLVGASRRRR